MGSGRIYSGKVFSRAVRTYITMRFFFILLRTHTEMKRFFFMWKRTHIVYPYVSEYLRPFPFLEHELHGR